MNKSLIEKIQKLLALAESPNEHEAKLAASKAQELLVRHNLKMAEIDDVSDDLNELYTKVDIEDTPYLKLHHQEICHIIMEYYFVHVFTSPYLAGITKAGQRKTRRKITFAGTPESIEIASYVYAYLSGVYQSLWLEYKRENNLKETSRRSYYMGLTEGICEQLKQTRESVETEVGALVVKDSKLQQWLDENFRLKANGATRKYNADAKAQAAGYESGKNVRINKGLKGGQGSATNNGKLLK